MGLGGINKVSLASARQRAAECRSILAERRNPIEVRRAKAPRPSFGECADGLVEAMSPAWRNAKHRAQWKMTLVVYAAPLRSRPVDQITTDDVLNVLRPIWLAKPETASRIRGRIERVLDAARAQGYRAGENPARWRGHLQNLLPKRQALSRGHHAAMPYPQVPAFIRQLHEMRSVGSL